MTRFATSSERNRYQRLRKKVLDRDGHRCTYCGCGLIKDPKTKPRPLNAATVDHVQPLALGGATEASNLVAACHGCNYAKGAEAWS